MEYNQILAMQKEYGYTELQKSKEGSKGSYKNCSDFWEGVEDGSIFLEKECTEE